MARHIARVAARLFATNGYDATPVRAIVEAAGVTKPTLYYHFGSKEGLARALLTLPMTALVETLRSLAMESIEPGEALERIFEVNFDFCRDEPDRARFFFALVFGPHGPGTLADELYRFGEAMDSATIDVVGKLAVAGIVDSDRVEDCARHCCGLIRMAVMDFLFKHEPLDAALGRRLAGDLLWGFGIPGSTMNDRGA